MYNVKLSKSVIEFLDKKDENFIKMFYEKIKSLEYDPYFNDKLDIKKFKNGKNKYRLRIGKYKFLFEVIE